jgi:hypothetical protein
MSHAQTAIRAADLAERIVDEISRSGQDWLAIERQARGLAELASTLRPRPGPACSVAAQASAAAAGR